MFWNKDGETGIAIATPMQPDDVTKTSQQQGCDKNCLNCSKQVQISLVEFSRQLRGGLPRPPRNFSPQTRWPGNLSRWEATAQHLCKPA